MKKIILIVVVLCCFFVNLSPCITAIQEKTNNYDLDIIEYEIINLHVVEDDSHDSIESDMKLIIKNIGEEQYKGKLDYQISTFPPIPISFCYRWGNINDSGNLTLEPTEELTYIVKSATFFGQRFLPYLYVIAITIDKNGYDSNFRNNRIVDFVLINRNKIDNL